MATNDPAGDTVRLRLQEAIERLQEDVRRVEIWAGALSGFLKPVPDYDSEQHRHMLPRPEPRLGSTPRSHGGRGLPASFSAPFADV